MPTTYKILGRKASAATTMEELYAVPSTTSAVISTITVCNRAAAARTYRIAIKPTTGTTLATDYLQTANDYLMSELEEEFELDEADEKEVGKEIKAARLKKDSSDFMSKSSLFSGGARDVAKHLGKKDDEKYGEAMRKVKDTPVSKFVASRKGDGKVRTEEAEKAPFDGGRPVKSKESAAVRVKKIAKGMEKLRRTRRKTFNTRINSDFFSNAKD